MLRLNFAALAAALCLFCAPAHAGTRTDHWSGFDIGVGGVPFPSIVGGMIGFNIGDDARIAGGVGTFSRWTTYSLDAKVFLGPDPWAAYIGAGLDLMSGTAGSFAIYDYQFNTAVVPYIEFGVDFQSSEGIHLFFNLAGAAPSGEITVLPGLAVGWYF